MEFSRLWGFCHPLTNGWPDCLYGSLTSSASCFPTRRWSDPHWIVSMVGWTLVSTVFVIADVGRFCLVHLRTHQTLLTCMLGRHQGHPLSWACGPPLTYAVHFWHSYAGWSVGSFQALWSGALLAPIHPARSVTRCAPASATGCLWSFGDQPDSGRLACFCQPVWLDQKSTLKHYCCPSVLHHPPIEHLLALTPTAPHVHGQPMTAEGADVLTYRSARPGTLRCHALASACYVPTPSDCLHWPRHSASYSTSPSVGETSCCQPQRWSHIARVAAGLHWLVSTATTGCSWRRNCWMILVSSCVAWASAFFGRCWRVFSPMPFSTVVYVSYWLYC